MRIGIIGGGAVGQALGGGFAARGHVVTLGVREPTSDEALSKPRQGAEPLGAWRDATGARVATLAEAAAVGEVVVNATQGVASLDALRGAGAGNLAGKVLIDVANPLDFSQGFPPFQARELSGPTSLGEEIQAAFPEARVVKAFNTVAAAVMVDPSLVPGEHDLFVAGNDADAKAVVGDLARGFGWRHVVDLGDIVGARACEAILVPWLRLWQVTGTVHVNLHVARAGG